MPYAILMIVFSVMLLIAAGLLYIGETGWLRSFKWSAVRDRKEYARYLGKCVALTAIAPLLSAVAMLRFGIAAALIMLAAGIAAALVFAARHAGKYYKN